MRIAHICLAAFYIDGFGYQENILPRMHKMMGHAVCVIASTENYLNNVNRGFVQSGRYVSEDGIEVVRLPYRRWIPRQLQPKLRAYEGLLVELENFEPDLIFIHDLQFFDLLTIRNYALRHKCRVVADCHTDRVNSARSYISRLVLHGLFYRSLAQMCDKVIDRYLPTLPLRADFLVEVYGLPREKMVLLPFGADDIATAHLDRESIRREVRARHQIKDDDLVFVTGGKLDLRKNIHTLIARFAALRGQGELANAHLLVFGAPDNDVSEQLARTSLDENVHLVGWQPAANVFRYFWAADIAIFPGTHSVLWEEAIGHGLGAVLHRWDGTEHLDLGGNVHYLDNAAPATLDAVLVEMSANGGASAHMLSAIAKDRGSAVFSYSAIAKLAIS